MWCWAGTVVPYWPPGRSCTDREPTRPGGTVPGPGPAPDEYVAESPRTFIHCYSVRSHAESPSPQAPPVVSHAPAPGVSPHSPVLYSLTRSRIPTARSKLAPWRRRLQARSMQSCGSSISGEFRAASWLPPQLRVGECSCFCAPGCIVVFVCGAQLPPVSSAALRRICGCYRRHEIRQPKMPHRSPPGISPHRFTMGYAYRVWGLFIETPSPGMP
jgi:hypothetical protein